MTLETILCTKSLLAAITGTEEGFLPAKPAAVTANKQFLNLPSQCPIQKAGSHPTNGPNDTLENSK